MIGKINMVFLMRIESAEADCQNEIPLYSLR